MAKPRSIESIIETWSAKDYNEDDLFQVFVRLSPALGHPFPLNRAKVKNLIPQNFDYSYEFAYEDPDGEGVMSYALQQICANLAVKLINRCSARLISVFCPPNKPPDVTLPPMTDSDLGFISQSLEKAVFLIGYKSTEEKLQNIVAHVMDLMLQQTITVVKNVVSNLECLKTQLLILVEQSKVLIECTCMALSASNVSKNSDAIRDLVYDAVLEKLSDQMARICDALKSGGSGRHHKHPERGTPTLQTHDAQFNVKTLRCLALLVEAYFGVEEELIQSRVLAINDDCKQQKVKKGVLKVLPHIHQHHNKLEVAASNNFRRSSASTNNNEKYWQWSEGMRDISNSISDSITHSLTQLTKTSLDEAKMVNSSSPDLLDLMDGSVLFGAGFPTKIVPKIVFKNIGAILKLMCELVPFAKLGSKHKMMAKLLFGYLDVINQSMKEIKLFLSSLIEHLPKDLSEDYAHKVLATATAVVLVLQYCGRTIYEDNRPPFHSSVQTFSLMCTQVEQIIIQHQKSFIATTILQSSSSVVTSNELTPSPLKDTQCSEYIKRWHSYFSKLYLNLKSALPENYVISMTSKLLIDSLTIFADRHCSSPVEHIRDQSKLDAAAIMHLTYNIMWTWGMFLDMVDPSRLDLSYSRNPLSCVRKCSLLCNEIFIAFLIYSAPLSKLCHVINSVNKYQPRSYSADYLWLTAVSPNLFPLTWRGQMRNLSDDQLISCAIQSLAVGPVSNQHCLTRRLLRLRNYTFAHRLLSGKLTLANTKPTELHELVFNCLKQQHDEPWSSLLIAAAKLSSGSLADRKFAVKLSYLKVDDAVRLPWQRVVYDIVMPPARRAVKTTCSFLRNNVLTTDSKSRLKEMTIDAQGLVSPVSSSELLVSCVRLLLKALRAAMQALTPAQCQILHAFHAEVSSQVEIPFNSFGACALTRAVHVLLAGEDLNDLSTASTLPEESRKVLKGVADILVYPTAELGDELYGDFESFTTCAHSLFNNDQDYHTSDEGLDGGGDDANDRVLFDSKYFMCDEAIKSIEELSKLLIGNCDSLQRQLGVQSSVHHRFTENSNSASTVVSIEPLVSNLKQLDWTDYLTVTLDHIAPEKSRQLLRHRIEMETDCDSIQSIEEIRLYMNELRV